MGNFNMNNSSFDNPFASPDFKREVLKKKGLLKEDESSQDANDYEILEPEDSIGIGKEPGSDRCWTRRRKAGGAILQADRKGGASESQKGAEAGGPEAAGRYFAGVSHIRGVHGAEIRREDWRSLSGIRPCGVPSGT